MTSEEKEKEGTPQETTTEDTGTGDKSEMPEVFKQGYSLKQGLDDSVKKAETLKGELTELMAKQAFGGQSTIEKSEEKKQTDREFTEDFVAGKIKAPF
jgi:hypothetical protein